jgi:hypothetical protein
MPNRGVRWGIVAAVLVLAAAVWWARPAAQRAPDAIASGSGSAEPSSATTGQGAPVAAGAPAHVAAPTPRQAPALPPAGGPVASDDGPDELDGDAIEAAWATVDLEAVRRALPNNRYWRDAAPTTDEALIEARAEARRLRNIEYGKVLSGNGSEAEIRAYYDDRARQSGDYVEFATYLLDHYEQTLHERDVALLQLARRMHLSRLEEIPRRMQEAIERKGEQDAARAAWQADEEAFRAAPAPHAVDADPDRD